MNHHFLYAVDVASMCYDIHIEKQGSNKPFHNYLLIQEKINGMNIK